MTLSLPLRFQPQCIPKVWGGERLARFVEGCAVGSNVEPRVGEVWSLVDRAGSSSVVAEGPLEGRSLAGLMLSERESLLGSTSANDGRFPLLIKYLDAAEPLSIQVHPDERAAERLGGETKDECWYVLEAQPAAEVYIGLRPDVDAVSFAAQANGHHVLDLLQSYSVRAGQFIEVPAGTVHAIGGGVTLIEVQQNADTTYRIFDWDRVGLDGEPRPLHRDEALQSIDYSSTVPGPVQPSFVADGANARAALSAGDSYAVDLLQINEPLEHDTGATAWVYVILRGSGSLVLPGRDGTWRVGRGETWLIPASLGVHRFESVDGELEVLRIEARG